MFDSRRRTLITVFVVIELVIVGTMFRSVSFGGNGHFMRSMASTSIPADVHTTVATSLAPHVLIDDDDATIIVRATTGTNVTVDERTVVHGSVSGVNALHVERTSDGVRIDRGSEEYIRVFGQFERTLTVSVPTATQLEIIAAKTANVDGLRGDASIHGDDGEITVNDHHGSLDVQADDGRVLLTNIEGADVSVKNDDGRVELTRVHAQSLNVRTNDGGVVARDLTVGNGTIAADDAAVDVQFAAGNNLTIDMTTSDGHVDIVPPLAASSDGDGDSDSDNKHAQLRIGNGGGHLDVSTNDGRITIAAESAATRGV